jgi:LEA14-like dessication related protein
LPLCQKSAILSYFAAKYLLLKKLFLFSALILLLAACQQPQGFDYRDVKNIKLENIGFDKTILAMDLVYYNPNGFGVDLKKVDCDVYVDNSYLGKFQLDTLMHIPRKAEFLLPSRILVDMKAVLKNGLNLLFSQEVLINVKGTTRVGKAGFFKTVAFNYEARHKLSLF